MTALNVGQMLIRCLEINGVDLVFGIPGVHTAELYRELASSNIRHITPRHEQAAAFMADGYARVSGKPGVCLLITGPGLTNAITAIAQAQQDSIPMLVISGVNATHTLGHGEGALHEVPDQRSIMQAMGIPTHTLHHSDDIVRVFQRLWRLTRAGRPTPVHLEIPTNLMGAPVKVIPNLQPVLSPPSYPSPESVAQAANMLRAAHRPVMLLGGGAIKAAKAVRTLAKRLEAPAIMTVNARGIMGSDPLGVSISPSLRACRTLIEQADCLLAIGTQLGPTDYDIGEAERFELKAPLIRIDIDASQMGRGPAADLPIIADARAAVAMLTTQELAHVQGRMNPHRDIQAAIAKARDEVGGEYRDFLRVLECIRQSLPNAVIVGDSTQPVYAGNYLHGTDHARSWFNAATGYGALGYGAPAAIGAALADSERPTICFTGDGGLQFSLAELGTAMDERAAVIFVVWNSNGYEEIRSFMIQKNIAPQGTDPSAPDFEHLSNAYNMPYFRARTLEEFTNLLSDLRHADGSVLIELCRSDFVRH